MDAARWRTAVARAATITEPTLHLAGTWDERAVRGVLAVAVAGIAERDDRPVDLVGADDLVELLEQGPQAVHALGQVLGLADPGAPGEAAAEWAWLTRRWPTTSPTANSGGLARGIGRMSELPAVDVCTQWALEAVYTTGPAS
ncbi:hypothetical protein ACFZDK_49090 [Streptomyces sp. NPDC007901]|uniref:hypothetical protein n=1 Tax=Streptomyces sp. NPDC007901 TaxID=3364785 RepID=UPI0036E8E0FA